MAKTTLTVNQLDRDGLDLDTALGAANADGSYFVNDGRVIIAVKNTDSGTPVVTFETPNLVDGLAIADLTLTMAAGNVTPDHKLIGPFPPSIYNDAQGRVEVEFSAVTNLSIAAIRV
jgi:hypothetical protein